MLVFSLAIIWIIESSTSFMMAFSLLKTSGSVIWVYSIDSLKESSSSLSKLGRLHGSIALSWDNDNTSPKLSPSWNIGCLMLATFAQEFPNINMVESSTCRLSSLSISIS